MNRHRNEGTRMQGSVSTSSGVMAPISTCTCIDCPITYKRHRVREMEIEATDLCNALHLLN